MDDPETIKLGSCSLLTPLGIVFLLVLWFIGSADRTFHGSLDEAFEAAAESVDTIAPVASSTR